MFLGGFWVSVFDSSFSVSVGVFFLFFVYFLVPFSYVFGACFFLFVFECRRVLDELTQIFGTGSIYEFQKL
jgi:uncharacterized membrane protein